VIDQLTHAAVGTDWLDVVDRGELRFKGVDTPVRVYAVRGFADVAEAAQVQRYLLDVLLDEVTLEEVVLRGAGSDSKRRRLRDVLRREIEVSVRLPA
jgi:hypothetical protein